MSIRTIMEIEFEIVKDSINEALNICEIPIEMLEKMLSEKYRYLSYSEENWKKIESFIETYQRIQLELNETATGIDRLYSLTSKNILKRKNARKIYTNITSV